MRKKKFYVHPQGGGDEPSGARTVEEQPES